MAKRKIFVVTHGQVDMGDHSVARGRVAMGGDPDITPESREVIRGLRKFLPETPEAIVCGTGRRHRSTAAALNLKPTRYTEAVGTPEFIVLKDGVKYFVFADGSIVEFDRYTGYIEFPRNSALFDLASELPDESVLIGGIPGMFYLGEPDARLATVYRVTLASKLLKVFSVAVISGGVASSDDGTPA